MTPMTATITRSIVDDLLPLYAAGEASADTRALVDRCVTHDPALLMAISALREDGAPAPLQTMSSVRDAALVGVEETKNLLRRRTGFLAAAVTGTLMPFSFAFTSKGVTFFMLRDAPLVALPVLLVGAAFWIAFAMTNRRLRVKGL